MREHIAHRPPRARRRPAELKLRGPAQNRQEEIVVRTQQPRRALWIADDSVASLSRHGLHHGYASLTSWASRRLHRNLLQAPEAKPGPSTGRHQPLQHSASRTGIIPACCLAPAMNTGLLPEPRAIPGPGAVHTGVVIRLTDRARCLRGIGPVGPACAGYVAFTTLAASAALSRTAPGRRRAARLVAGCGGTQWLWQPAGSSR
jgi:hypothetical protein